MLCVEYALLHCCVMFGVLGGEVIGMRHNPVLVSLGPSMMFLLLYFTMTFVLSNSAVHPASHSFPIEIKELWLNPGMVWASRAAVGKSRKFSMHVSWFDWRMVPSGKPTLIGGFIIPVFVCGSMGRI
jgi:hypothetical protein